MTTPEGSAPATRERPQLEGTVSSRSTATDRRESLEWTVEPATTHTGRWVLYGQVAALEGALGLAALLGVANLAITGGVWALLALAMVSLAAVLAWRYGFAAAPLERWRPGGAGWGLEADQVAGAFVLGVVGYAAVLATLGLVTTGIVALAATAATGAAASVVGNGAASGRLEPGTGTGTTPGSLAFAGRDVDLKDIPTARTTVVGDLVVIRLGGDRALDRLRWLAVPEPAAADLVDALERVGVRVLPLSDTLERRTWGWIDPRRLEPTDQQLVIVGGATTVAGLGLRWGLESGLPWLLGSGLTAIGLIGVTLGVARALRARWRVD
ncbi:hypothetical protein [Natronosalvus vescus]|uniref:hypothetical protein n=1 Tax=Natronosalvus vescus TaxID=2953881 RepID=UPI002090BD07|nr:hypothetical protein [Natronosalvus vescus]